MYVLMYNMPMPAYSIKLTVAAKGLKHFFKKPLGYRNSGLLKHNGVISIQNV